MMIRKICTLALVIFFLSVTGAYAQGRPEWIAKVSETIKLKEPTWKIGEGLVNDQGASYTESIRLTKGGVTGAIEMTSYSILTNPEETFTGLVTVTDNLTRKSRKKVKLAGLGDEGYMWAGNAADHATVFFKKDRVFVTVFLPGRANAERFARLVASHIP